MVVHSGGQRRADALAELARRALEGGRLPQAGGVRPQLSMTVDLASLLGRPGAVGGEVGGAGALDPEACRRLACDSTVIRVLVTRHPNPHHHHSDHDPIPMGADRSATQDPSLGARDPSGMSQGLQERLRAAVALVPPVLGGAPPAAGGGRATRGIQPAHPIALAVRDRGGVVPGCDRPWPGVRPTTWSTGGTAAPPTWPPWSWGAARITGRSMRAAGG